MTQAKRHNGKLIYGKDFVLSGEKKTHILIAQQ